MKMWKEGTFRLHATVIPETTSASVLFSTFIRESTAFVKVMRKMTQARVLFFFLILLNSVLKPKPGLTLFSCSAAVVSTINTAWGHVQFSPVLQYQRLSVTQAERRRSTWSLSPCLSFQCSGQFGWNGDKRIFTGAAKYETNLIVRSKDLCGVVYQIIDVEIDDASPVFLLNGSLV